MNNQKQQLPIGIFDSGIGGLTVVKEIRKRLPNENIIYLGDTARVPYGTKSSSTVISYSLGNAAFLSSHNIKLLVVACNTASAFALDSLKSTLDIPVIGVLEPGALKAVETTRNNVLGVIGTPSTIKSEAYREAVNKIGPNITVHTKSCPLFVPLAEEGWIDDPISEQVAVRYLKPLINKKIDTLILGCTHYPLLKKLIQRVVGDDIKLVDSAEQVTTQTLSILEELGIKNPENKSGNKQFYLTDVSDSFLSIAASFLGEQVSGIKQIDIKSA